MLTDSKELKGTPPEPDAESPHGRDRDGTPFRVPAHGAGLLRRGNTGQGGRPKQAIRDKALSGADKFALPILERIANDPNAPTEHKIRAAELLLRYGLGTKDEVQLQDREAFLAAFARYTVRSKMSESEAAEALRVMADELGIE